MRIGDVTFIKSDLETVRGRRNAVWNYDHLWPVAVVPYGISPVYSGK